MVRSVTPFDATRASSDHNRSVPANANANATPRAASVIRAALDAALSDAEGTAELGVVDSVGVAGSVPVRLPLHVAVPSDTSSLPARTK